MKDDIKEILDNLEDTGFMYKRISLEEIKKILDYITNLQEELKEANESITWWFNRFKAVEKDNTKLKQEKDKYYEENLIISQEILNLQEELESKNKEIKDLKNRLYTITTKFN